MSCDEFIDLRFGGRSFLIIGRAAIIVDHHPAMIEQFVGVGVKITLHSSISINDEQPNAPMAERAIDSSDHSRLR